MEERELASYYEGMLVFVGLVNNYIEFEDIEKPIHSSMKSVVNVGVTLSKEEKFRVLLNRNSFFDNTNLFQLYSEDSESNFLTVDEVISNVTPLGTEHIYVSVQLQLSDKLQISKRRVYSTLTFLGDVGGLFGSACAIGAAIHFLFLSDGEDQRQFLQHYFRVSQAGAKAESSTKVHQDGMV